MVESWEFVERMEGQKCDASELLYPAERPGRMSRTSTNSQARQGLPHFIACGFSPHGSTSTTTLRQTKQLTLTNHRGQEPLSNYIQPARRLPRRVDCSPQSWVCKPFVRRPHTRQLDCDFYCAARRAVLELSGMANCVSCSSQKTAEDQVVPGGLLRRPVYAPPAPLALDVD
jgi:hypothetical protein